MRGLTIAFLLFLLLPGFKIPLMLDGPNAYTIDKIKKLLASGYPNDHDGRRKFIYNAYDLNGDGNNEFLVGLIGTAFCDSDGCKLLVLNNSFDIIGSLNNVKYPVYVGSPHAKGKINSFSNLYIFSGQNNYEIISWAGDAYHCKALSQSAVDSAIVEIQSRVLNVTDDFMYDF